MLTLELRLKWWDKTTICSFSGPGSRMIET
jgi:hypothetical protein